MQIGSVVRHRTDGDIGIITAVYDAHIAVVFDGMLWKTYKHKVEVICE